MLNKESISDKQKEEEDLLNFIALDDIPIKNVKNENKEIKEEKKEDKKEKSEIKKDIKKEKKTDIISEKKTNILTPIYLERKNINNDYNDIIDFNKKTHEQIKKEIMNKAKITNGIGLNILIDNKKFSYRVIQVMLKKLKFFMGI